MSLYSYFQSRRRCGVVGNCYAGVKDMYLVPLAAHERVPRELLPFNGPGWLHFFLNKCSSKLPLHYVPLSNKPPFSPPPRAASLTNMSKLKIRHNMALKYKQLSLTASLNCPCHTLGILKYFALVVNSYHVLLFVSY